MAAVAGAAHLLPPLPAQPWPWLSARLDSVPYSKYSPASPAFSDASSDQVDGRNTPHAALTRPPDKSRLLLRTFSPQLLALLPTLCLLLPDGGGCLHAFDPVHRCSQGSPRDRGGRGGPPCARATRRFTQPPVGPAIAAAATWWRQRQPPWEVESGRENCLVGEDKKNKN
jgi:hypothetical protein